MDKTTKSGYYLAGIAAAGLFAAAPAAMAQAVSGVAVVAAAGTFKPITDMIGGGPFGLEPGQWTDDTSMALCLAESLIEKRGFAPERADGSVPSLVARGIS
jgi:hypothetical protein